MKPCGTVNASSVGSRNLLFVVKIMTKREGETTEADEGEVAEGGFSRGRPKELLREPKGMLPISEETRQS